MTRGMHKQQTEGMAAAATSKTFTVGQRVSWVSQASGSWKSKTGTVVSVVPAKKVTDELRKHGLATCNFREHESYIVHVPSKSGRGKGVHYWPLASKLQAV